MHSSLNTSSGRPNALDVFFSVFFLLFSLFLKSLKLQSRLCRDAGESDTSHLGLWSVGRGEKNRLLVSNMSRTWCKYLLSQEQAVRRRHFVGIRPCGGKFRKTLDSSVVQADKCDVSRRDRGRGKIAV